MRKFQTSYQKNLVFFLIVILPGCAVHSIHNESFVSESLRDRTGHQLPPIKEEAAFKLPDEVFLDDGITEDEAVAVALWNNAQFQADLVALGFARADLIQAGLLRNPILSLLFPLGPKQLEATVSLPFDFLWQRPKRVAAAQLNAERIAENLIQNGLNLIREVKIAHAELAFAREREKIILEEVILRNEIAAIAAVRLKVGDISAWEEAAFRLEAARTQGASIRFSRDAKLSEEKLKTFMGLGMKELPIQLVPTSIKDALYKKPSDLLNTAFAARPDLRAAEIAIESAGERVGWERSKIFNFTALLDANGEGKEGFEMGPGAQVELPLFNWNEGKISQAQADLKRAVREYIAVKHRITQEVRDAYARFQAAQQALNLLRDNLLPPAETAAKNAEEAYAVGEISYLELLDFKRQFLDSRLREAEAEAEIRRAEANLAFSIGFKPNNNVLE